MGAFDVALTHNLDITSQMRNPLHQSTPLNLAFHEAAALSIVKEHLYYSITYFLLSVLLLQRHIFYFYLFLSTCRTMESYRIFETVYYVLLLSLLPLTFSN